MTTITEAAKAFYKKMEAANKAMKNTSNPVVRKKLEKEFYRWSDAMECLNEITKSNS